MNNYTAFIFYGESYQEVPRDPQPYFPTGTYRVVDGMLVRLIWESEKDDT